MNTAPECVDMTESLRRGAGRLLYNGDEGSLVLSTDGTFLLSDIQDGALLCEKIRTLCPAAPKLFTVKSDDAAAALMREFSLHDSMRCTQWVYEKGEPPCPVTADIRPLTQEHAALAASVYHDGDGAYIRNRIEQAHSSAYLRAMPSQASPVFMTTAAWACSKFYRRSAAAGMPRSWKHF